MEFVGAGLGDDVQMSPGGTAVLRSKRQGLAPELLQSIQWESGTFAPANAQAGQGAPYSVTGTKDCYGGGITGHPIHGDVVGGRTLSIDAVLCWSVLEGCDNSTRYEAY